MSDMYKSEYNRKLKVLITAENKVIARDFFADLLEQERENLIKYIDNKTNMRIECNNCIYFYGQANESSKGVRCDQVIILGRDWIKDGVLNSIIKPYLTHMLPEEYNDLKIQYVDL